MNDTIWASIIGVAGSALGSVIGILTSQKIIAYRLEQLEKKVQAHNNLVERMYRAEEKLELNDEKLKVANHRISDLERRNAE